MVCSCNKDCEHLEEAKACKEVEENLKICTEIPAGGNITEIPAGGNITEVPGTNATEVPKPPGEDVTEVPTTNACLASQFFDKENNCRDLNECGINADCEDAERNICKEQDGKRTCVEQMECFSKCSTLELCDSKQRCVALPPCNSDEDCSNNTTCVSHGTTGLKSCQPESVEIAKMDECLTTVDCPARDKNRTICKEDSGRKTCVRPEQCLSTCGGKEVCTNVSLLIRPTMGSLIHKAKRPRPWGGVAGGGDPIWLMHQ